MAATLGVLVAGGAGVRLGLGVPKALARVGELTLLERGVRTLQAVCDEVVVAAPAALVLPMPTAIGGPPAARVADAPGAAGPLAGVVAGLASRPYTIALVLGVDFPCVSAALLEALRARLGDRAAVVPAPGGIPQPLVAAYAPGARAILTARLEAGERSLLAAVEALDAVRLDDAGLERLPGGLGSFLNVNTRDDLAEAERRRVAREAAR